MKHDRIRDREGGLIGHAEERGAMEMHRLMWTEFTKTNFGCALPEEEALQLWREGRGEKMKDDWKSTPATTAVRPHEIFTLEAIKQAEIRGAAEMLEFIDSPLCDAWETNEEILKQFKIWREGRGK